MTHPIVACAADIRASLKAVATVNPTFMNCDDKATALRELVRAEGQLAELRLRILPDAGDLAVATAAKDAAGWLTKETRTRFADARADLTLATALDRELPVLAAAMREGQATLAQAHVIRRAIAALPSSVDADVVAHAEAHLVASAGVFGPKELGRLGRHILHVGRTGDRRGGRGPPAGRARSQCSTADPVDDAASGRWHHPDLRAAPRCSCYPVCHLPRGRGQPPQARLRHGRCSR